MSLRKKIRQFGKKERIIFLILTDILLINLSAFLALFLRFELNWSDTTGSEFFPLLLRLTLPNTLITLAIFAVMQLYMSLWDYAGTVEIERIVSASALSACVWALPLLFKNGFLPRSFPILYGVLLCLLTACSRFSYRLMRRARLARRHTAYARTMLIGAGQAGAAILREFAFSRFSRNKVVCLIDDDPQKQGQRLMGIRIVGGRKDIADAAEKYRVSEIVIAIPTLSAASKKELLHLCSLTGCKLKWIPGLYQIANEDIRIQQIRDVDIEDLLEREVVSIDMEGIAERIRGKTVLVTGAGGSIGSELCRQLAGYRPGKLVLLDIYENNVYAVQQELLSRFPSLELHVLIGSVRDENRLNAVMDQYPPDLVYHAAAHKHVPLMEDAPLEAIKNNVFGTLNTARAAAAHHAEHFVLISSDKAVNPTNVMGASKRICELIIQLMDEQSDTCFSAVRFGNVLGSNGSVIPLFKEQIRHGGPVTVTHPEINRFFMTIPEAVSLVLQSGAFARGGEIFILDMGKPVKIDDLARNMIRLSGFEPDVDIPIVYTGLRPGEKLYEELLLNEEGLTRTANDLIYVARKTEIDRRAFGSALQALHALPENQTDTLRSLIQQIVPTYSHVDTEESAVPSSDTAEPDAEPAETPLSDLPRHPAHGSCL